MKKLHPFTDIDTLNYNQINSDTNRHLRYHDYKHLQGVNFDNDREESTIVKIMASMGFIMCLIVILFIA